jgi:hypothetical protein
LTVANVLNVASGMTERNRRSPYDPVSTSTFGIVVQLPVAFVLFPQTVTLTIG